MSAIEILMSAGKYTITPITKFIYQRFLLFKEFERRFQHYKIYTDVRIAQELSFGPLLHIINSLKHYRDYPQFQFNGKEIEHLNEGLNVWRKWDDYWISIENEFYFKVGKYRKEIKNLPDLIKSDDERISSVFIRHYVRVENVLHNKMVSKDRAFDKDEIEILNSTCHILKIDPFDSNFGMCDFNPLLINENTDFSKPVLMDVPRKRLIK
jgi:hypothetical protein